MCGSWVRRLLPRLRYGPDGLAVPGRCSRRPVPTPPSGPPAATALLLPTYVGMAPVRRRRHLEGVATPRACGDGPSRGAATNSMRVCSPHARGWSRDDQAPDDPDRLLPAPAGMVPPWWASRPVGTPAPRTRGDSPGSRWSVRLVGRCSPHPRGWSRDHGHGSSGVLLPAPAGMVPKRRRDRGRGRTAPCTRGDGPGPPSPRHFSCRCSLHPRGWSHHRDRESPSGCSPRPRGWPRHAGPCRRAVALLPAPAGMAPPAVLPRPRDPAAPRTRGNGPSLATDWSSVLVCSPHPQGWSRSMTPEDAVPTLLPASAGMVPASVRHRRGVRPAPRACGDGPGARRLVFLVRTCSPRPRGWPRRRHRPGSGQDLPPPCPRGWPLPARGPGPVRLLLPAPAGMVPRWSGRSRSWSAAPCARGDGPNAAQVAERRAACSPHVRGWPRHDLEREGDDDLLPAHVGLAGQVDTGHLAAAHDCPQVE